MAVVHLTVYESDGATLKTAYYPGGVVDDYESFKFSLNRFGGMGGASFMVSEYKDAPFKFAAGDVVKATLAAGGELVYTGIVASCARRLAENRQEYTLKPLWDAMSQIDLSSASFGTAAGGGAPTTVATILQALHTTFIAPLGVGIAWNGAKVSAPATVELLKLRSTGDIYNFLQVLLAIAGSDGNAYACGVDEAGDFFFLPTPATVVTTVDCQDNADGANEYPNGERLINAVAVAGGVMKENGRRFFRKLMSAPSIAGWGRKRIRPIVAPEIVRAADAAKLAAGIFARYSVPQVTIQDLSFHPGTGEAQYVPRPWMGRLRYVDASRLIDQTAYLNSIDIVAENELSFSAQVGLGTVSKFDSVFGATGESNYLRSAAGDSFAPAVLDRIYTPTEREKILADHPEATEAGLVDVAADSEEPHMVGLDVPFEGENGSLDPDATDYSQDYGQDAAIKADLAGVKHDVQVLQAAGGTGGAVTYVVQVGWDTSSS